MLRVENLEVDKTNFLALKLFTFQKGRRVKRKVSNQVLHVLTPGVLESRGEDVRQLPGCSREWMVYDEQTELLRTHIYL